MKIVKIHGGLGNQMFEYAFARSLASEAGSEVFLDIQTDGPEQAHKGYELGRLYDVSLPLAKKAEVERLAVMPTTTLNRLRRKYLTKRTHFIDRKYRYQGELFARQGDAYYEGYWQSEKYFARVETELRREFTFRPKLDEENLALLDALPLPRASVHVRRDDYAGHANLDICTAEYYGRAIRAMREGGTASFAVFSDDIDYCRKTLDFGGSEASFIDRNQGNRSWQDM
ncbi:MAG: alpha-1,2-fucosyltransferase, partial [Spirochaetota bacterium]